jgi:hypothetical protein
MVSTQKPNENQLSIAKQFIDQFPHVNRCCFILSFSNLALDYCTIWNMFSIKSNNE